MDQSANTACTMPPRAEVIASLNDQLRKTGVNLLTPRMKALPGDTC